MLQRWRIQTWPQHVPNKITTKPCVRALHTPKNDPLYKRSAIGALVCHNVPDTPLVLYLRNRKKGRRGPGMTDRGCEIKSSASAAAPPRARRAFKGSPRRIFHSDGFT
ncbi:hypothetical protein EVAR_48665_1 [Eumeta japonica]|uniref:Uncharacterized protein n=1 Tax=Eumeta variegata TaxID=151549 RepID=A0A4C1XBL0_EUMVA|nr:hypothetical protein EVAR_48665_1 [Eumeta japonica]